MRPWSIDGAGNVKVRRYGFPVVPDFGGTAHAYCGSTLDACLGDVLPWSHKPRRDDALRAYIIKSRARDASKLLLARPYSPHLFRQGVPPGPHLLMEVLQKKMTPKEAHKAWKEDEKKHAKQATSGESWLDTMTLPCRRCTDKNGGEEVWRPLSSFGAGPTVTPRRHLDEHRLARARLVLSQVQAPAAVEPALGRSDALRRV